MKKTFRMLALLLSVVMLLASCGGDKTPAAQTTQAPPVNEDPNGIVWHHGYISAVDDGEIKKGDIIEGADYYSYTDVICIPKKGTMIRFVDDDSNSGGDVGTADSHVYTLSTWKEVDGKWVFQRYMPAYAGSAANQSDIVWYEGGKVSYTYVTTKDNECVRLCYRSGQTASFTPSPYTTVTIEETDEKGTASQNWSLHEYYQKDYEKNGYQSILSGLTVNALGDSYFAGRNPVKWPELLSDKYDWSYNNYGIGGSTVSNYVTNKDPMCERFQSMKNNNPDIVILEGGRNDFSREAPIGTPDSTDTKTFMGALNVIIDGLQKKYPDAMIVCVTAWNFPGSKNGLTHKDYVGAMKTIAAAQGVYCIDASIPEEIGVDMTDAAFRSSFCIAPDDVSHLNDAGMRLVMPNFEKKIVECYTDFLTSRTPKDLEVVWKAGYVGSASNTSHANKINDGAGSYVYTEVFTIPKAGTTITFVDDNAGDGGDGKYASTSAYVISSWKQEGGKWVIDLDRANYPGSTSTLSDVLISYKNGAVTYSYTTSLDNENLRLCYRSGKATAHPTVTAVYTGADGTAKDKMMLSQWIEDSKKTYFSDVLKGLTINSIGDSYFAGNGMDPAFVWLNLMAKKYGQSMNNYGVNASMVSNYTGTNNPMCLRYSKMANNSPAIVLIEGGKNDYNQATPLGTVDSRDDKTFMGALNVIVDGVKTKYPNAMIVLVTPWNFTNTRSHTLVSVDYADAMKQVAQAQGVYCIYAYDTAVSGVDMTSESFRSTYCMTPSDVSHLNPEGMKLVFPKFEKLLAEYYTDFLSKK